MKPPHDNRHGGSARPPSNRSSERSGTQHRPFQQSGGPRHDKSPGAQGGQTSGQGPRRDNLRPTGVAGQPARQHGQGPRPPHHGHASHDHEPGGQRPQGKDFQTRSGRDGQNRPFQRPQQRHDAPRPIADSPRGTVWLYGQHAIAAALANPARRLRRLLLTEEAEAALVEKLAPPWPLQPERAERGRLDHLLGRDIAHQGAALLADPLAPPTLQHALERPGPLLVLDQVTDPRNVGAILRTAASFGAAAVITQDRNAPEETGALAKAASGALETMPLLRAVNIARTLIALKAANIWVVGLDAGGSTLAGGTLTGRRVALVLGAEGSGLRRLTRDTCDEIAGFAMLGAVGSLNVSAAAAVALYEVTRPVERRL